MTVALLTNATLHHHRNEEFRPKLIKFFQRKKKLEKTRTQYLTARYEEFQLGWQEKLDEVENNAKQK